MEHQGYDSFFGCMLQTPFFFLAAKLKKISQNKRMLLSVLSVLLVVGVDSLAGMIALLYSGVIMHAFSITTLLLLCFVLSCLALGMCLLFVRTNRMKKEGY